MSSQTAPAGIPHDSNTDMADLHMTPAAGERLVRHAGDRLQFTLHGVPDGWKARLRTNLGRAERVRDEIVRSHFEKLPLAGSSWRDLPLQPGKTSWSLTVPLTEVGWFKAKAYAIDPHGFQHWVAGPDVGISVHPSWTRTGNVLYCAFPRMLGRWSKEHPARRDAHQTPELQALDEAGFTVIPPGGTLRDLVRELPHIFGTLGCRILHLLPVGPTPTTFARFGRFGSPYAVQDLTAIDPALVEFDRRTTAVDQFRELAYAVHSRGARLFIDIVINHTGWGSTEWNNQPGWFRRTPDGHFESPGAWDVVWEDLVEFDQRHKELWEHFAEVFLTWCRRGVDGFRCDAGYKVPTHVWQYITARVRQEFPDTVFLLEGLGGSWEATDALLTEGGMQWAYSELFQNHGAPALTGYLDHHLQTSYRSGTLVHYSETHDNARLAARGTPVDAPLTAEGRRWSLHRNQLSALASIGGGFGFTCGVEWCATEQVNVHSSRGLNWGHPENLVPELARLNRLLADHPCFFADARVQRVDPAEGQVILLRRQSADGLDTCLVVINPDFDAPATVAVDAGLWREIGEPRHDLAAGSEVPVDFVRPDPAAGVVRLVLEPGAVRCLAATPEPLGSAGEAYRHSRARADWALAAYGAVRDLPDVPSTPWPQLATEVEQDPAGFLARTLPHGGTYPAVVAWEERDARKVTCLPPGHWLLVRAPHRFRATLRRGGQGPARHAEAILVRDGYVAAFAPGADEMAGTGRLEIERYGTLQEPLGGDVLFLSDPPPVKAADLHPNFHGPVVLLTNERGGMARLAIDLGRLTSKYDCLLGANLHPAVPVDRHVLAKRLRAWLNADGFITPLDAQNLVNFEPGPPAHWRFVANAGDGRSVEVHLVATMLAGSNTVVLRFARINGRRTKVGRPLPPECDVRLVLRVDLEDRGFHQETKRNNGADHHFHSHTRPLTLEHLDPAGTTGRNGQRIGFEFTPAPDRALRVYTHGGVYHHQPEWSQNLPHPVEASRGMEGSGDAWSPGWFDVPLPAGGEVDLVVTADPADPTPAAVAGAVSACVQAGQRAQERAGLALDDTFGRHLGQASQAYVVRRDDTRSVIAGYPWFLDWGRDSLIAARGLLAAGMTDEVRQLLLTFARFEEHGTLPNSIHGENAANRDTSDAPLWLGIVAEELAVQSPEEGELWETVVDRTGRKLRDVLRGIAVGYLRGTPNHIRTDPESGLVWSPAHFTWMDTNHPAGTPREGYPVEIQVLWIRLLRLLDRLQCPVWEGGPETWADRAALAQRSLDTLFWLEDRGWLADCLLADAGQPARTAVPSDALRSNCLLAVALDLVSGQRARRMVGAALRHLVVPGALRSLAPLPVHPPLPIRGRDGGLLNDPSQPYWGRYEGDEDTRRKPAYHNGTAWTWTFPALCEALVKAYPGETAARSAARALLGSMATLFNTGCLNQIPEILDGDAPHTHRGCDAQAWGVTEALRVWRWLNTPSR